MAPGRCGAGEFEFSRGFTNIAMATQAAVAGQGIALVTYSTAREDLHRGALRLMRGIGIPYPRSHFLVISNRKAQREKVLRFRAWIEEQMAAMQRELDELTAAAP
jgi:LysR family glycine cleavage system transcriptional activator